MSQLLEVAKEKTGFSYYRIARELKVTDQLMNNWKHDKSQPNGLNTLKLAALAGLKPDEAIKLIENGFISLSLLIVTGLTSTLAIASVLVHQVCILCKIKR